VREAVRLAGPRPLWARILLAAECSSSPAPPSCRREEAGRPTVDNGPGGSGETGSGEAQVQRRHRKRTPVQLVEKMSSYLEHG